MHQIPLSTLLVCLGLFGLNCGVEVPVINKIVTNHWAVLVAGSNGWWNYRHQADICHTYHILRKRGIPESNIITMMYDDIANNDNNPYPGKIFNDYDKVDVYAGVNIDYKEEEVTPEMFMRVMKGDPELAARGKKVLQSGPDDNVFVFFSDHGADGLIAFPNGELYASQLNDTITFMSEKQRYNMMVLYIEACYSGSMFHDILSNKVYVFATTAANEQESSYAAFCEDTVLNTCLADEYSYNWMVDSEGHNLHNWTLEQQYRSVKKSTRGSHVMQYGDLSIGQLPTADFQTQNVADVVNNPVKIHKTLKDRKPAHKAHLIGLAMQMTSAKTERDHEIVQSRLQRAIDLSHIVKHAVEDIVDTVKSESQPTYQSVSKQEQMQCFESIFPIFKTNCFSIQQVPEVAQQTPRFQDLCKHGYPVTAIRQAILKACT